MQYTEIASDHMRTMVRLVTAIILSTAAICCGGTEEESVEELQQGQSALRQAIVTGEGILDLSVASSGNIFEFHLQLPLDAINPQQELAVHQQPGGALLFTAMVPGGDPDGGLPDADCHMEIHDGEEMQVCEVPYVGYGSETPTKVTIGPGKTDGIAIVHFDEFGSQSGDNISMEYVFMYVVAHEDMCHLFYDYSRHPIEFIVGQDVVEPVDGEATALAVGGPVFAIDMASLYPSPDSPNSDSIECSLELFPSLFEDFCPVAPSQSNCGQGDPPSHWHERCCADYPELGSYPVI